MVFAHIHEGELAAVLLVESDGLLCVFGFHRGVADLLDATGDVHELDRIVLNQQKNDRPRLAWHSIHDSVFCRALTLCPPTCLDLDQDYDCNNGLEEEERTRYGKRKQLLPSSGSPRSYPGRQLGAARVPVPKCVTRRVLYLVKQ